MLSFREEAKIRDRGIAFFIDYIYFMILMYFFSYISIFIYVKSQNRIDLSFISIILLLIFLCRDILSGQSIGKRLMKLGVRDMEVPNQLPSRWMLIFRNITLILFPVEILSIILTKNNRRFGDILTKTMVVKLEKASDDDYIYIKEYEVKKPSYVNDFNDKQIHLARKIITIIIIFATVLSLSISYSFKNSRAYEFAIEEIEKNEEIRNLVGDIYGYGFFTEGSMSTSGDSGYGHFEIKVKGKKGKCKVYVEFEKEDQEQEDWEITRFKILN